MTLSDARRRANQKWNKKNKDKIQYYNRRSTSKSFISKSANEEDLKVLQELITDRLNGLK